jgi:ribosomal protein L11 methyltransferase
VLAELEADEKAAHRIADGLSKRFDAQAVAVSLFNAGGGRWRVAIHFRGRIDEDAARAAVGEVAGKKAARSLGFARLEATDWVRKSLAQLAPVAAGRFIVHGAHDRARVPVNRISIEIEAALAFGTGHHGTTRGCLLALDRLCKALGKPRVAPYPRNEEGRSGGHNAHRHQATRNRLAVVRDPPAFKGRNLKSGMRILDVGTGSGVLAIAVARALRRRVLATDVDAGAVAAAGANIRLNRAGPMITLVTADGVGSPQIRARAPFDLIFANILLAPLQRMAAPLRRLTAPNAYVVLSGISPAQANTVIVSYRPFAVARHIDIDGWSTLVFIRRKVRLLYR